MARMEKVEKTMRHLLREEKYGIPENPSHLNAMHRKVQAITHREELREELELPPRNSARQERQQPHRYEEL